MRQPRPLLSVVPWLFGLMALIDVTFAVVRAKLLAHEVTDIAFSALARAQVCLLFAWLATGQERPSTRLAATLGGTCFVFLAFTYASLARISDIGSGSVWLDEEWERFFYQEEAGRWLLTVPWLAAGTFVPLALWRLVRGRASASSPGANASRLVTTRFGLIDMLRWTTAICMLLAIVAVAPYPSWPLELGQRARVLWTTSIVPQQLFLVAAYCLTTTLSLLVVRHHTTRAVRFAAATALFIVAASTLFGLAYPAIWPVDAFELVAFVIAACTIFTTIVVVSGLNAVIQQLASQPRP